jgi:hypothetical protein
VAVDAALFDAALTGLPEDWGDDAAVAVRFGETLSNASMCLFYGK